jgi:ribokinase
VDTNGISVAKNGKSGTVLGLVDKKGARALYINSGVNDTIEPRDIKYEYVSQTQFIHFSSFIGEKPFRSQKKLIGSLPKSVKFSFDPGSVYTQKGFAAIEPLIQNSNLLLPNAGELELLTGETNYRDGADFMIGLGVKIVAVKLGEKGCYVTDGNEKLTAEPFKVKAVDTTGAGDAFNAGFLYGLLKNKSLYECGRIGNFVASRCVMQMGARAGLPHEADLTAFFG